MDKELQVKEIHQFLTTRYRLEIGNWISLSDLLDSTLTYSENLDVVCEYLKQLLSDHPDEVNDRLGSKHMDQLWNDIHLANFRRIAEEELDAMEE